MKGKCEQLLAAINYLYAVTAAAARQGKGHAAPGTSLKKPLKSKVMKIINHVFVYLKALTWSVHYITSRLESPEIK